MNSLQDVKSQRVGRIGGMARIKKKDTVRIVVTDNNGTRYVISL